MKRDQSGKQRKDKQGRRKENKHRDLPRGSAVVAKGEKEVKQSAAARLEPANKHYSGGHLNSKKRSIQTHEVYQLTEE